MSKSFISSLKRTFKSPLEDEAVPTPDLSRVIKHFEDARDTAQSPAESAAPERDALPVNDWLSQDVATINASFKAFAEAPENAALRRALFLSAHNLRGAAEPMGNPDVARLAASLCKLVEIYETSAADLALAQLHVQAIGAAASGEEGSETTSAVCVALEDNVRRLGDPN